MLERLSKGAGLSFRPIEMRRFEQELQTIVDIFNDAWSDNWGFVPMTPAEVRHMGKNLKPIVRAEYAWIGEVDGEPAAMTVTLPNSTRRSRTWTAACCRSAGRSCCGGSRCAVRAARACRSWACARSTGHAARRGAGARRDRGGAPLARRARREQAELSWVLEDNRPTRDIIELVGGRPYKTYRVYEKTWRERRRGAAAPVHRAGARRQPRAGRSGRARRGVAHKCLVPVAGVPMAVRVVETLAACPSVGRIALALEDRRCSTTCRRCAR